jgi:hypothetical protein
MAKRYKEPLDILMKLEEVKEILMYFCIIKNQGNGISVSLHGTKISMVL